jgi:DNA-binding protein Fis
LKLYGIDVSLLQKELLTKYRISLSYGEGGRVKIAFPESHGLECNRNPIPIPVREFMIENIYGCKYFEQAYKGLEFLCSLLKKSVNHHANILDLSDGYVGVHSKNPKSFIKNHTKQHEKMIQGIRSFVEERASTSKRKENDTDIFKMTEKEMIEYHQKPYLEGLLKRTAGNQTEAAKIACLPLNTFRDHCKKYGLS